MIGTRILHSHNYSITWQHRQRNGFKVGDMRGTQNAGNVNYFYFTNSLQRHQTSAPRNTRISPPKSVRFFAM